MSNFTQNAKDGFVKYCEWVQYYPAEIERATELAMVHTNTMAGICDLSEMIRQLNDKERWVFQTDEFVNRDDGVKTVVLLFNREWMVKVQDLDSGKWLDTTKIFPPDSKAKALSYAKNVAAGVPTS